MDVGPIELCVEAALQFVKRCSQRGKVSRVLKASSDKDEIAALNVRVDRVRGDLGLAGVAAILVSVFPLMVCFSCRTPPPQYSSRKGERRRYPRIACIRFWRCYVPTPVIEFGPKRVSRATLSTISPTYWKAVVPNSLVWICRRF